jgi:hypothetical protein
LSSARAEWAANHTAAKTSECRSDACIGGSGI